MCLSGGGDDNGVGCAGVGAGGGWELPPLPAVNLTVNLDLTCNIKSFKK